jgi:hypothetical protein
MRTSFTLLLVVALLAPLSAQPSTNTVTEEYPDRFSLDVTFPRFYEKGTAAVAADKAIAEWIPRKQKSFTSSALKQVADLGVPTAAYELKISSEVTFYSPKRLISVTLDTYEYLGGAHGISTFQVFNFGDVRGKAKQLALADLFRKGSSYKPRVSELILAKLKEDEEAARVQSGEVKSFSDAQLNRFQIHPEGLTFLFEHSELAPYSGGRFRIELSVEELGPDFEWAKVLGEQAE